MKKMFPAVVLLAGVILGVALLQSPVARAVGTQEEKPVTPVPLGCRCVALLDPKGLLPPAAGATMLQRVGVMQGGFTEGILVHLDEEWVVLKDGSYENWIPMDNLLLLRASR